MSALVTGRKSDSGRLLRLRDVVDRKAGSLDVEPAPAKTRVFEKLPLRIVSSVGGELVELGAQLPTL